MRNQKEIKQMILDFAEAEDRIKAVVLEGSRTNKNVPKDEYQDYDISFFVDDIDSFKQSDNWLNSFGEIIMLQKPEDMELFPPELGNWFSYLMIFSDFIKIDLTLIPIEEIDYYFESSDGLAEVWLDKDKHIKTSVIANDFLYHIKKPSEREFDDCCNEFWFVSSYVIKGIKRKEFLFSVDHFNQISIPNLLRMISYSIGIKYGFHFSLGKNYKYIDKYLSGEEYEALLDTFHLSSLEEVLLSFKKCMELFIKYSKEVALSLKYRYPNYEEAMIKYNNYILSDKE